jgi:hypothetical protein
MRNAEAFESWIRWPISCMVSGFSSAWRNSNALPTAREKYRSLVCASLDAPVFARLGGPVFAGRVASVLNIGVLDPHDYGTMRNIAEQLPQYLLFNHISKYIPQTSCIPLIHSDIRFPAQFLGVSSEFWWYGQRAETAKWNSVGNYDLSHRGGVLALLDAGRSRPLATVPRHGGQSTGNE